MASTGARDLERRTVLPAGLGEDAIREWNGEEPPGRPGQLQPGDIGGDRVEEVEVAKATKDAVEAVAAAAVPKVTGFVAVKPTRKEESRGMMLGSRVRLHAG